MHSAALLLLPLLPLTAAQSVIVTVSDGITATFTLPAWLYPPSGTASSTITVTPTATLVVIPVTTIDTGLTTTTVYVGSSTTPSPTTTKTSFNSAVGSYLSSIMSVETAGSSNASSTSTATVSSTSTTTATTTVIASMSIRGYPVSLSTSC